MIHTVLHSRPPHRFRLSSLLGASLITIAISFSSQARAQQSGAESEAVDASLDAEARALYEAGELAYQRGRFENALEHFSRAYKLSQRPELLYNIGSAADRLRLDEQALDAFLKYLEALPEAPNRAEVQSRIKVLQKTSRRQIEDTASEAAAVEKEARPEPESAEPEPTGEEVERVVEPVAPAEEPRIEPVAPEVEGAAGQGALPWIVAGTGVALGGAGAVLFIVGQGKISDVEGAERGSRWEDYEADADTGPTLANTGVVLIGVGAAALATGVAWLAVGGGKGGERVAVAVTPSGVTARGRF